MSSQAIRVFVAESHALCRDGVVAGISRQPDLEVVGQTGDGRKALHCIVELAPDVAVLAERLPGLDANQVLGALDDVDAMTQVVVLGTTLDSGAACAAIAGGASGYLEPETRNDALHEAIRVVARGEAVVSPGLHSSLLREIHRRALLVGERALSERARHILSLVADGRSDREIAVQMHLSEPTVKVELRRVFERLGAPNRAGAVGTALRRGLIE